MSGKVTTQTHKLGTCLLDTCRIESLVGNRNALEQKNSSPRVSRHVSLMPLFIYLFIYLFIDVSGSTSVYRCTGNVTEYTRCVNYTTTPVRRAFKIPKEYHDVAFL